MIVQTNQQSVSENLLQTLKTVIVDGYSVFVKMYFMTEIFVFTDFKITVELRTGCVLLDTASSYTNNDK